MQCAIWRQRAWRRSAQPSHACPGRCLISWCSPDRCCTIAGAVRQPLPAEALADLAAANQLWLEQALDPLIDEPTACELYLVGESIW